MMVPDKGLPADCKPLYRFDIKARSGKRGPKRGNFHISLRDYNHWKRVEQLMAKLGPGSYLAAIKQVADEAGLSEQSIRHAYDDLAKRSRDLAKRSRE
jgi:hypothetical protein